MPVCFLPNFATRTILSATTQKLNFYGTYLCFQQRRQFRRRALRHQRHAARADGQGHRPRRARAHEQRRGLRRTERHLGRNLPRHRGKHLRVEQRRLRGIRWPWRQRAASRACRQCRPRAADAGNPRQRERNQPNRIDAQLLKPANRERTVQHPEQRGPHRHANHQRHTERQQQRAEPTLFLLLQHAPGRRAPGLRKPPGNLRADAHARGHGEQQRPVAA